MQAHNQDAPGELECVRRFINTWSISNQTRVEMDSLPLLIGDPEAWRSDLSLYPRNPSDSLDKLLELRSDLRKSCESRDFNSKQLNAWFSRVALSVHIESVDAVPMLSVTPAEVTYVGHILAVVANAIASGTWSRLKTCSDCQWAFYDHTRNASKRWCGMTKGGPNGRACGTIAKVRAFRSRAAAKVNADSDAL
jgi:predicted RNA-binding Zn ribbon-like protein